MKRQFVDLFDPGLYGWNVSAAVWLLVGFFVSYFISMSWTLFDVAMFAGADSLESYFDFFSSWARGEIPADVAPPIEEFLLPWMWGFTYSVVLALALIGLAHVIQEDYLLPFFVGGAALIWDIVLTLLQGFEFDWQSLVLGFAWPALLSGSLVVCYRISGYKLVSVVPAFLLADLLDHAVICLVFWVPPAEFLFTFRVVINLFAGLLAGVIFYRGLAVAVGRAREAPEAPEAAEDVDDLEHAVGTVVESDVFQVQFIQDENDKVCAVWFDAEAFAHDPTRLRQIIVARLGAARGGPLVAQLESGSYRIEPNTTDERGGSILSFNSPA
jgi:hypothetical protein